MINYGRRHGLTLTSIMVAVALSGVLAVAGVRLVVNQVSAMRMMELLDKGDAIYKFYSNMLHDDKVWFCTLYEDMENDTTTTSPNKDLRNCVFGKASCSGSAMDLKGPDCQFHEPTVSSKVKHRFTHEGKYDFTKLHSSLKQFESSQVTLIPSAGKTLKDSVMQAATDGWWDVKIKWEDVGQRAVDIVFTQDFIADKWMTEPTSGKRYLPTLNYPRELRVRRSANYVPSNCSTSAVTAIALHSASRTVSCHSTPLVDISSGRPLSECPSLSTPAIGQVVESNTACSGDRGSGHSYRLRTRLQCDLANWDGAKCEWCRAQHCLCAGWTGQDGRLRF